MTDGFLDHVCCILIPQSALSLLIRDKNRMRFYEKVIKVKADVAALLGLISFFWGLARSSTVSRFLGFLLFLFLVAFATFPQKIWR